MAQIDDLTLEIGDTGIVLKFIAQNGRVATLDIERLADRYGDDVREVLLSWCQDRRDRRKSRTLAERQSPLLVQDYAD